MSANLVFGEYYTSTSYTHTTSSMSHSFATSHKTTLSVLQTRKRLNACISING
ncbi:hypothetical protein J6590_105759, partial [Homalodisca vitripennis]